jgi:hypothetical protein
MNDLDISKLYRDLDLGWYLTKPCNRSVSPYQPESNGWNKGMRGRIIQKTLNVLVDKMK